MRLNHFDLAKHWLNPCYFQPPETYFGVHRLPPQPIDADVLEYCSANGYFLPEIFRSSATDGLALFREALPHRHKGFADIASRLVSRGAGELLPHYLADYVITKIFEKAEVDADALREATFSFIEPNEDQKEYLSALLKAAKILPQVQCAHCGESIHTMGIELAAGSRTTTKIILRARCSKDPYQGQTTTFLAYSWKTGQTLVYGDPGVFTCNVWNCRCLTHDFKGKKIGRRGCPGNANPDE